ncbi:MAG TPA: alpha/beta hydrolase, partial [Methylibium sp.]
LVRFMLEAGEVVRQRAATWATPTLLMWAGGDRCVAPRGSAQFAAASSAAPPGIVSAREFAPLYHEIFNEPQKQEVFVVLRDWLAQLELPQG